MSEVTLDEAAVAILGSTRGEVVVRNPKGEVVGRFRRTMSAEEMASRNPFTLKDLERAQKDPAAKEPGEPLSEFWKRIRAGESQRDGP